MGRNVQHLTMVETGCQDCAWQGTSDNDRKKKAEAQRHADAAGHTTWADSYYSTIMPPRRQNTANSAQAAEGEAK